MKYRRQAGSCLANDCIGKIWPISVKQTESSGDEKRTRARARERERAREGIFVIPLSVATLDLELEFGFALHVSQMRRGEE